MTMLLLACGSSTGPTPTEPDPNAASSSIGAAGGQVALDDGSSISVPSGALQSSVNITIEADATAKAPSLGTQVGQVYLLGPEGQQFSYAVTVTIPVDPTLIPPGDSIRDVVVYTAPRDKDDYVPLVTKVVDSQTVSVETLHFSHFVPLVAGLHPGEYMSVASNVGDSPYIGDYENNYGYVLGYLLPGARIYAKTISEHSVYGLIFDGHYGAWDHGHHCGWVSLDSNMAWSAALDLPEGNSGTSPVADSCPDPWKDPYFSLAQGQPKGIFKPGSWEDCDGCVQPAIILPTCTGADLTVYANYDPETGTFSDPDGEEVAGRGTTENASELAAAEHAAATGEKNTTPACDSYTVASGPHAGLTVGKEQGYCGFGTRFVTADGLAVEIKDTERPGKHTTAFGFMHSYCIAGAKVGEPAGSLPCGTVEPGHHVFAGGASFASCNGAYSISVQASDGALVETDVKTGVVTTVVGGEPGDLVSMQTDGNLVMYRDDKPLWASKTEGHDGARLLVGDDGELEVYDGKVLWSWKPGSAPPPPAGRCCAKCSNFPTAYYAGDVEGESCKDIAVFFCAGSGGKVESEEMGTCADAPK
jgi:hypothetical protein